MSSVSPTDVAYAAGIVDGEGTICLSRQLKAGKYYYLGRVAVINTSYEMLEWLGREFDGQIYSLSDTRGNYKPLWQWSLSTQWSVLEFLQLILPFLKVKQQQARLMSTFMQNKLKGYEFDEESFYLDLGNLNGKPKSARSNSVVGQ